MDESLVSVIIPVYEVEPYLYRCVGSVLKQTFRNLEILLVDDGSPDDCPMLCDEYAVQDSRIKVIHKKNGGLSEARNIALDICQGKYVTFVDSDDYISTDYVETLYRLLTENGADISCVQFIRFHEGMLPPDRFRDNSSQILNPHDALRELLYFDGLETSANCKLYRADLFRGVRYPVGKLFEDLGTTYKLLLKSNKIANSHAKKYYYLQRAESIEQSPFSLKKMDLLEMCEELGKDTLALYPDLYKAWDCRYFCANFHIFLQIPDNRYKDQAEILKRNIRSYRKTVLWDRHARTKARVAALLSYLGMNLTRRIWRLIKFIMDLK